MCVSCAHACMQAEQEERHEAAGNDKEDNALETDSSDDEEDEGDAEARIAQHSKHNAAAAGADPLQKGFRSVTAQLLMKYGGTPSKQSLRELQDDDEIETGGDQGSEEHGGSGMDDDDEEEECSDVEENASPEEENEDGSSDEEHSGESEGRGNGVGVRLPTGRMDGEMHVGNDRMHAGAEEDDDFGQLVSDAEAGSENDEGTGEGGKSVLEGAGSQAEGEEEGDEDEGKLAAAEVGEEEVEAILRQIEQYTEQGRQANMQGAEDGSEEGSGEEHDDQMELLMQAIAIKRAQNSAGLSAGGKDASGGAQKSDKGDHDAGDVSGDSTQDGAEDVVPYTPEVPQDAAEFAQMAKGLSAGGVEELVRRIRMYNANALNAAGRVGLQQFCAVLLRRFTVAAAEQPLPQGELQGLVGALAGVVAEVPLYAATLVRAHLKKLFEKARGALDGTE